MAKSGAERGNLDVHGPDTEFFERSVPSLIVIGSLGKMVAPGPRKMFNILSTSQTQVASFADVARSGRMFSSKMDPQSLFLGSTFPLSVLWSNNTIIDVPMGLKDALSMDGALKYLKRVVEPLLRSPFSDTESNTSENPLSNLQLLQPGTPSRRQMLSVGQL
jgi:hypothetical protein